MRIGIYTNVNKDPDGSIYRTIVGAAQKYGIALGDYSPTEHYDFVVSIGGDGTILRVVKDCARAGIPILGVNCGTVGFLTETEPANIEDAIKRLAARDYLLERRSLLDVTCGQEHFYALNDAVVMRSGGCRVVNVSLSINGVKIDKMACDGYIVATPTGSTAYSLSAGGPVVAPNTGAITMTPVSPHNLRARAIVAGSGSDIELMCDGEPAASLFVDGTAVRELSSGDVVKVTGWDICALFVRFGDKSFYSRLIDKLGMR